MYTNFESKDINDLTKQLNAFEKENRVHIEETSIIHNTLKDEYQAVVRYTNKVFLL